MLLQQLQWRWSIAFVSSLYIIIVNIFIIYILFELLLHILGLLCLRLFYFLFTVPNQNSWKIITRTLFFFWLLDLLLLLAVSPLFINTIIVIQCLFLDIIPWESTLNTSIFSLIKRLNIIFIITELALLLQLLLFDQFLLIWTREQHR